VSARGPEFDDIRTHLDGVIGYPPRLASADEIKAARQRLDRWAVHKRQQSVSGFVAEWGIDPADVPLPNYPDGPVPAAG
jgi:hypothetical protein